MGRWIWVIAPNPVIEYLGDEMKKITAMKHLFASVVLVSACSILLVGCRESSTPVLESPLLTPDQGQTFVSPQPTPASVPPFVLPTPSSADVATIGGVLMRDLASMDSEPITGAVVYLARVIRSEDGTAMMAVVEETAPTTVADENGRFVFTDVPSKTYGIAISTPLGPFLVEDNMGEDLLFAAQGGAVLDLGEIRTPLPY